MGKNLLPGLMELITENYHGTILVTDASGRLIFVNEKVCINCNLSREELLSTTIYELVERGVFRQSSTIEALETKKVSSKVIEGKLLHPLMTTSVPVLEHDGSIKYVIAYSQDPEWHKSLMALLDTEQRKVTQIAKVLVGNKRQELITESAQIKALLTYMEKIAKSDATILIYGESGSGKEVAAMYIHENSARSEEIFLPINCAAFSPALIESELFGYDKGAFTGASSSGKPGLFEVANNGTLFLDEVGELSLPLQAKLLRVLEAGEIQKVGSSKPKKVNTRIIAATNRDLEQMVKEKTFREDLFYRLNIFPVEVPPIRSRKEDIVPLALSFLASNVQKYGIQKSFSPEALDRFKSYNWPGNVREIRNVVERLCLTATSYLISYSDVNVMLTRTGNAGADPEDRDARGAYNTPPDEALSHIMKLPYKEALLHFEKQYIETQLQEDSNVSHIAKNMGISRSGLYYKLRMQKEKLPT